MLSRVFKFVSVLLSVHLILERWANLGHPVKYTKNYLPLLKPKKKIKCVQGCSVYLQTVCGHFIFEKTVNTEVIRLRLNHEKILLNKQSVLE